MESITSNDFRTTLSSALQERLSMLDEEHRSALRLFNGFLEGCPDLTVDLYGRTLVLQNYADQPNEGLTLANIAHELYINQLDWLEAIVLKSHRAASVDERRGKLIYGEKANREILEHGVRYALNLTMNQDASFYLDTRNLRRWLLDHMAGKTVLNTFAYTGSLGAAALAGGAQRVVQTDISRRFLNLGKTTYTLNGFPIRKEDFLDADFYNVIGQFKGSKKSFDCVILDPPFFSSTAAGKIDLVSKSHRLINKVRPVVAHNGWLIAINNALFVNGADYMHTLETLCADGYLQIEKLISVPEDMTGFAATRSGSPPTDPAPFDHSTKIAVLRVLRKDA
ncbi:MAG: class I SAM-dependent methyltransferase [Anaerolineaceae bacterium]|nr:class I SAM-dependent methyltransferase [Anaerolineaceae bacterium]